MIFFNRPNQRKVLNSADYGLPQVRRRVFFIGSLKKCNIIFPEPTGKSYVSIKEAINNLPKLKSGQTSKIANHVAMNHSDQMLKKMKTQQGETETSAPAPKFNQLEVEMTKK